MTLGIPDKPTIGSIDSSPSHDGSTETITLRMDKQAKQ